MRSACGRGKVYRVGWTGQLAWGRDYHLWVEVGRQVSACRPSYFLLLRQKKVSKEKASQRPWPCGLPCATRVARGRAQTRYAQTSARPDPRAAALLSTANGPGGPQYRVCSFAALTLHTLHTPGRATRAGAEPPASACAQERRAAAVSAPSPNPLTTTASFPNLGEQTRPATSRTNTPLRPKTTKLGI